MNADASSEPSGAADAGGAGGAGRSASGGAGSQAADASGPGEIDSGPAAGSGGAGGTATGGAGGSMSQLPPDGMPTPAGAPSLPPAVCGDGKVEGTELCDGNCPTLQVCTSQDACLAPVLAGDAKTCDAHCDMQPITACVKGDGCCPASCKYPADDDCSKSCGDGVVDTPETCEPNHAKQPCPASCDDGQPSTKDVLTGSASQCSARCSHTPITTPMNGDDYCPPGAHANNDRDCMPVCGNDVVEMGEVCDGKCPTSCAKPSDACTVADLQGSGCGVRCVERKLSASRSGTDGCCPQGANANTDSDCPAVCGNGVTEAGEICDAMCPRSCPAPGAECATVQLVQGGTCNARCVTGTVSPSGAMRDGKCCGANSVEDADCSAMCGNGVREGSELCDGDCPSRASCDDRNSCTMDSLSGAASSCNAKCSNTRITAAASGDGCCPDGVNANDDSDCQPRCGNDVTEDGELCDGNCPTAASCADTKPCTKDGVTGSGCNVRCDNTPITESVSGDGCCIPGTPNSTDRDCPTVCGNGIKETGEDCDPMASGEVVGYSCDIDCKRLNRLTPCTDGASGQCQGSPPSVCDSGFCRPTCPNRTQGALCDPLPGATLNGSICTGEPLACAWLCAIDQEDAYCGPNLWCDGTYCRVKP